MAYFEIHNLSFRYNNVWIFKALSLQGEKGELLTIVGPSGCGKTTLLKILVGILAPEEGRCQIGEDALFNLPIEKRRIGYVPQNQALFPHLSVFDNIAFGLKAQNKDDQEIKQQVQELARLGGLNSLLKRKPHELSGGQQQRTALLRALAPAPRLLLLDEPLSNVDSQLREQLALYIRRLQQLYSITTIFVTHDLNEAKMISDKIVVLSGGQILQIGTPMDVSMNPSTSDVASTIGIKNLFPILSMDKNMDLYIVQIPIGNIQVKLNKNQLGKTYKGVYIDPTQLKLIEMSNKEKFHPNIFTGKVIASIPHPMESRLTLIVDIGKQATSNSAIVDQSDPNWYHSLRILLPLSEKRFKIGMQVMVDIPYESIRLYT
ncbi:MAG: ABC transporter ATP-binding protein [Candidatus Heimdallarchaeota archaeon]|nr:ABC transporter ATP-binding protein [Candidatus Heimdallarchaeota archaeon]